MKILLDAGHGKGSNYNRGSKFGNEGDNNFKFSLILKRELEKYGFIVGLTRPVDTVGNDDDLYRRGSMGAGYDLFLSLHTNAGGGTGVEIYNDVNRGNYNLADKLCKTLASVQGITNRGVKHKYWGSDDYYGVLRFNKAKAGMLVEHCFHDNYKECKWYYENMEKIATAEAKCIADFYGKTKISGNSTESEDMEIMERLKDEKYLINGNYSIDSLPWGCDDKKNLGTTKEYVGKVVTVTRKWDSYWYVKELGGFVDHRAFEKVENVNINATVKNSGYSVDTLPWGMKGFERKSVTGEHIGKSVKLIARYSAYYLADGLGWIDEKAFGLEKKEKKPVKKSAKELAREVVEGKWGNGQERKDRLTKAGYDYDEVQREVNKIAN